MRPVFVVVLAPILQLFAGVGKGQEPMRVQTLRPEATVERLDESVDAPMWSRADTVERVGGLARLQPRRGYRGSVIGDALLWKVRLSSHGVWKLKCWSQTGEAPEVLSSRRKQELVSCTVRVPEAQAREAKDSLEMSEQHLDFLPPATSLHVLRS
jgi:hypothetical protein